MMLRLIQQCETQALCSLFSVETVVKIYRARCFLTTLAQSGTAE